MSNSFDKERLMELWDEYEACFFCGKNGADAIHHIHRRSDAQNCSTSVLNSCPIHNYPCHINNHGKITTEPWIKKFLNKTAERFFRRKLTLLEEDKEFLVANKKYYISET